MTGVSISIERLTVTIIDKLLRCRAHAHGKAVRGRFAGFARIDPMTGDFIVASSTLPLSTAETCPLHFTDAGGNPVPGPIGTLSASDPSVTVALSADGQAANVTMTAPDVTATLTWTGDAGAGAFSFTVDVTDVVVFGPAVAGSFGTFAPGTTA